jgi:hypothetical protein
MNVARLLHIRKSKNADLADMAWWLMAEVQVVPAAF